MSKKKPQALNSSNWAPGKSGNPRGRSKDFKYALLKIKQESDNGLELIEFAFSVFRGEHPDATNFKYRMEAFNWLSDRLFGKAPQVIELSLEEEGDLPDVSNLSDSELEALERAAGILESKGKKIIDV